MPYARNSRTHSDEQINQIAASIKEFGFTNPVLISPGNDIIAGHGRVQAAHRLGLERVPTIRLGHLSDAQRKAYVIADNRLALNAGWDTAMLTIELHDLKDSDFDLNLLGFEPDELAELLNSAQEQAEGLTDPDAVPENVETRCKPGDLWILGNHRLLCGDSTNVQHVERLMNGEKADICFTSPPYNAARDSFLNGRVVGFDKKYQTHTDDLSDDDYANLLSGFTSLALEFCSFVFVNLQLLAHNRIPLVEYQYRFREHLKDILIWNKKQCPPNIVKGAFNTKWEYVFCYSHDNKTRGFPASFQGQHPNVVETESNSGNEFAGEHKAGFPVTFPLWFIERLDFVQSVYDPFCGTGTTVIACEKTGRRCFGLEIDPKYCDTILSRWESFTGKQAVLEESQ